MDLSQAIQTIQPSIVQVGLFVADFPEKTGQPRKFPTTHCLGTGFFVNSEAFVITARHVVEMISTSCAQIEAKTRAWFRIPEIADSYLTDVETNPGNSGAPVYLAENANVIGVCVANKPALIRDDQGGIASVGGKQLCYSSGLTIVIPICYVIELMRKNKLEWSEAT